MGSALTLAVLRLNYGCISTPSAGFSISLGQSNHSRAVRDIAHWLYLELATLMLGVDTLKLEHGGKAAGYF